MKGVGLVTEVGRTQEVSASSEQVFQSISGILSVLYLYFINILSKKVEMLHLPSCESCLFVQPVSR